MALLAAPAKCAIVDVVGPVAGVAVLGKPDRVGDSSRVASMATKSGVSAGQWELGLRVVVEPPKSPAIGIVARRTALTEAPLVKLVLVAAFACRGRALERLREMAFLTGHRGVLADQGKAGKAVIKGAGLAPASLTVAPRAIFSELSLVHIVLAVAVNARA